MLATLQLGHGHSVRQNRYVYRSSMVNVNTGPRKVNVVALTSNQHHLTTGGGRIGDLINRNSG